MEVLRKETIIPAADGTGSRAASVLDLARRRALLLRRRKRSWWRVAALVVLGTITLAWVLLFAVEMFQQV